MDAVFLKILNMSFAASWLVLAIMLLRLVLRKAPRWIVCFLWAFVALRLLCPFTVESALSLLPSSEVLPVDVIENNSFDIHTGVDWIDMPANDYLGDRYYEEVTVPTDHGSAVMTLLCAVWVIGVLAMLIYASFSYLRLKKKVSACIRVSEDVRICDYIATPFILGILRPEIYLPSSMEPENAQYVLAHERAHLKRRDHWWKPLGFLLLAMHWFNPVMWVAYILLCRDIELACDEKVIREMGCEEKRAYSQALLQCSVPRRMIAACPLAFGEIGVKERVKSVVNYRKPAFWLILTAIVLCIAVAVCFLTNPIGTTPNLIGMTLGKLWNLTDRDYLSVTVIADGSARVMTDEAEIRQVLNFLDSAKVNPQPTSQNRIERAANYQIVLSDGEMHIRVCFDVFLADVWMDDGEYSLPYFMKDPDEVKAFFERMIGKMIPDVTPTEPESGAVFEATVKQISEGNILVEPAENAAERASASEIWVRVPENSPDLQVGDRIVISYDGMIAETYPAQIHTVYAITVSGVTVREDYFDLSPISDRLGTDDLTFFDIQTWETGAAVGCQYEDGFALGLYKADGTGTYLLDYVFPLDKESLSTDEEIWSRVYSGKYICIVNDTRITGIRKYGEDSVEMQIRQYPALVVIDYETGDRFQTILTADFPHGYIPSDTGDSYVQWANEEAEMILRIRDGWEFAVIEKETDGNAIGIQFRPEGEEGWIRFSYYPDGFGVCGTGLETVSGTTAMGHLYEKGFYDGNSEWAFLVFQGLYRNFAVLNETEGWFSAYEAEIMEILDSAMLTVDK